MDIKQISDALNRIFTETNKRLIFWYDGEKEFDEILPSLEVNDAAVLRMDDFGAKRILIPTSSVDDIPTTPANSSPSSRPASIPIRWTRRLKRWVWNNSGRRLSPARPVIDILEERASI